MGAQMDGWMDDGWIGGWIDGRQMKRKREGSKEREKEEREGGTERGMGGGTLEEKERDGFLYSSLNKYLNSYRELVLRANWKSSYDEDRQRFFQCS